MKTSKAFYDVSVCQTNFSSLKETCQTLLDLGYRTVAINQVLEEPAFETKKKKKKGETREITDLVPPPVPVAELVKEFEGKLLLLNRLTFSYSDQLQAHKLNQSKNLKKYNLIAAIPTTQAAFQYACSSLDVDIITFDPGNKYHIRFNRKTYNLAVERGLFFELMYTPAILDATARKNIIHVAHLYHSFGKSKNIIISSWASNPIQVRGPYDIINLGLIFGLSEEQAKDAITNACRILLLHGEGRRCGKAVVCISRDSVVAEDVSVKMASPIASDEEMDQEDDIQSAQKRLKQ